MDRAEQFEKYKQRFWSRVNRSDSEACWPWSQGYVTYHGYGRMSVFGKPWYSHHLAWLFTYGELPEQWILHRCGHAICCNPTHLYEGTPAQNGADRARHWRERGWRPKSPKPLTRPVHRRAWTPEMVGHLKGRILIAGESYRHVASTTGISKSTLEGVVKSARWQDIQPLVPQN